MKPRGELAVRAAATDGRVIEFRATLRIDTPVEMEYYCQGGILQAVLRRLVRS
jgi:aconitate hydratase